MPITGRPWLCIWGVAQAQTDNNSIEPALGPMVLRRRHWLHVGPEAGSQRAAHLFSLRVTCKRLGVEAYAYLHDILRRLPSHPHRAIWQLTPPGWKDTFRSAPPAP